MKSSGTLPKGFTCHCGAVHTFPPYVYAHWHIELVIKCQYCQRQFGVIHGKTFEIVQAKGLVKKCKESI